MSELVAFLGTAATVRQTEAAVEGWALSLGLDLMPWGFAVHSYRSLQRKAVSVAWWVWGDGGGASLQTLWG